MKHVKLFESFINEKDEQNISIKKAKRSKTSDELEEGKKEDHKEIEDKLEKFFKKLVPPSGKADTLEGEMVRSIMRIWYRYYNDGDFFFKGYGKETAKPSVDWLKTKSPLSKEMKSIFAEAQRNSPKLIPGHKWRYQNQYDDEKD